MYDLKETKLVVVVNEIFIRKQFQQIFKKSSSQLYLFSSANEAIKFLDKNNDLAIVICELTMPDMCSSELILQTKKTKKLKNIYFILITNFEHENSLVIQGKFGADDYIKMPLGNSDVFTRVRSGIRFLKLENELRAENNQLVQELDRVNLELSSAAKLHRSILPETDMITNGLEVSSFHTPCQFMGGDFYGYRYINKDVFSFYQIDVSGHGVSSALFSFSLGNELLKTHLASESLFLLDSNNDLRIRPTHSTVKAINQSNALNLKSDLYFTMIYGLLNTKTGQVKFCQAGHPHLIHFNNETKLTNVIGDGGFPVGVIETAEFEEQSFNMKKSDRLFMFSDGLTEALDVSGEMYGYERICELIKDKRSLSIKDLLKYIYQQVVSWTENEKLNDDVTITAFQWNGEGENYEFF
ncbi:fused response regulator/phosphatase [Pseudoalteromonas sp. NBT06-2]|uniref:fused response regulator/phosphatase n=1 Tax=Pseudoalteromonas sp. NBT06-2 TaxID=2025950 RepID=UPI001140B10A|nr:fused response regulator/phosphatase [Pseudoalteromonas sp. NBT06-2]